MRLYDETSYKNRYTNRCITVTTKLKKTKLILAKSSLISIGTKITKTFDIKLNFVTIY